MAELFSKYASGTQFTAGVIVGNVIGVSGINPIVDRLNSIAPSDSVVSGTDIFVHASGATFTGNISGTTLGIIGNVVNALNISGAGLASNVYSGTYYWSCPGANFIPNMPDTADISIYSGYIKADANGISLYAPVFLPHGAVVTGAIVYGNISDESWELYRVTLAASTTSLMATEDLNSEDTAPANPIIDNSTYTYVLETSTLDTNDRVYGARVTYTL